MKINKYSVELNENQHPLLIKESSYDFDTANNLSNVDIVFKMLNECFRLGYQAEEHLCLIAMDIKLKPLAIFEVAHGTSNTCIADSADVFKRAMLVGASRIILAHNHPSGDLKPSIEDRNAYDRYKELGQMLGIRVEDFVIVAQEDIFSLRRDTLDL